MLTVQGNTSKIEKGQSYIVEQAAHYNLPHGLVVNTCCVIPKARKVSVILTNIWVRQSLLATELFEAEVEPQWYFTELNHKGDEINISFLQATPHEGQKQVENNTVEVEEISRSTKGKLYLSGTSKVWRET